MAEGFILEAKGITKYFPGIKALDGIQFNLKRGEIHALMGENGAGKSTFVKIISGVNLPEAGEIFLNGERVILSNPIASREKGIAVIYQNLTSFPDMTVTENIFIGHEIIHKTTKRMLWSKMNARSKELLLLLGSNIDPKSNMGSLSVAEQQMVEIAKALSQDAKIILMDEPTAALTKKESEELYKISLMLKDKGASIIYISHRVEDIYKIADRVTVFRDGKYIGTWNIGDLPQENLIKAMIGREITQLFPKKRVEIGGELLRVENLTKTGTFGDISFTVRKGEILGITGLVGAKRSDVAQALFGMIKIDSGRIFLEGKEVKITSSGRAMDLGIGYLPEDKQKQGLILLWSIVRNITLPTLKKYSIKGWLRENAENLTAGKLAGKLNVKAESVFATVDSLSGGNQQKVVVAKLLSADLKLIILDEPTKGIDVGAKAAIHEIMSSLVEQGFGIIMISSEMPEVLGMSDRVVVMRDGRITAVFNRNEATQEKILEAAMIKTAVQVH